MSIAYLGVLHGYSNGERWFEGWLGKAKLEIRNSKNEIRYPKLEIRQSEKNAGTREGPHPFIRQNRKGGPPRRNEESQSTQRVKGRPPAWGEKGAGQGEHRSTQHHPDTVRGTGVPRIERCACSSIARQYSEVGAVCGNAARTVLCGGRSAMVVPTATTDVTAWKC
jgi:hypothetical protein